MARRPVVCLLTFLTLAGSAPRLAADALPELLACRAISQAAARLACFDRGSAALVAARARRPAQAVRSRAALPSLAPEETFGLPEGVVSARGVAAGALPKPLSHLSTHIDRIMHAADGRLIFVLGNGQTWVQLQRDRILLAAPGDAVTLFRQTFGSYWMRLRSGRGCKVTRVR